MKNKIQNSRKTCAITGASAGIGKATAIELARQGNEIIMIVRDSDKSRMAFEEIKSLSGSNYISMFFVDLASFDSIRNVVDDIKFKYQSIDVLINNAGLFTKKQAKSEDGFELTIAVNYLAPFLLTNLLLPIIKPNGGKIINLSSALYKNGKADFNRFSGNEKFNGEKAYADSKLLIVYFTKELAKQAKQLKEKNITVNCLHPGVVATDVFREYPKWFNSMLNLFILKPEDGAKPVLHLATSPDLKKVSGKYFHKMKEKETEVVANDENLSNFIWKKSMEMTKLK